MENTHKFQPRTLVAQTLTHDGFSAFGDVIAPRESAEQRSINEGHTTRFHDLAELTLNSHDGRPTVNIFRSNPLPLPLRLKLFERHPLSSQAFVPLSQHPYLVVVGPAGDFDLNKLTAFIAAPGQGVNYHPGTWHHYSLALNETSDFLVIDRDGPGDNCDEVLLEEPDWIHIQLEN